MMTIFFLPLILMMELTQFVDSDQIILCIFVN